MIIEITKFFSVNSIFFQVCNYQMSYLEFVGTLFNLCSVWLVTRNSILTWPVGNIGVILFGILFYQIRLYSDFIEQIYFLITGFYGWIVWLYLEKIKGKPNAREDVSISYNSIMSNRLYLVIIAVGSLLMGSLMQNIHLYLPKLFPEKASFPFLDTFTTVMSFAAQILMAHKKIECWYLWILVDIIGIGLYFKKGVIFVSMLYLVFLILATKGLFNWKKLYKEKTT